jgi:plasmid stabilization system protein ParE
MDYKVILSRKAVRDLEVVVRYIALDNPETARKLGERLLAKTK